MLRSFDDFLLKKLLYAEGKRGQALWEQLEFLHLHGSFGSVLDLPYGSIKPATHSTGFNQAAENSIRLKRFIEKLQSLPEKLKIIFEAEDDPFTQAHKFISEADEIYMIGFGYGKDNVHRLDLESHVKDKCHIRGSDSNRTLNEIDQKKKLFGDLGSKADFDIVSDEGVIDF